MAPPHLRHGPSLSIPRRGIRGYLEGEEHKEAAKIKAWSRLATRRKTDANDKEKGFEAELHPYFAYAELLTNLYKRHERPGRTAKEVAHRRVCSDKHIQATVYPILCQAFLHLRVQPQGRSLPLATLKYSHLGLFPCPLHGDHV